MKAANVGKIAMLAMAALIWGIAFVAQSVAMDYVEPFTFNGARMLLGGLVLLPVIAVMSVKKKKKGEYTPMKREDKKTLFIGALLCGIALCVATNLQQFALKDTDAGKAGFITALYIVLVPILGIFLKKKARWIVWAGVVMATVGMYMLCVSGDVTFAVSDLLLLLCALVYGIHILIIDKFSPLVDGVKLSCLQFFVCGFITLIMAFIFEKPDINDLIAAYVPLLYTGILSSGVAYTLQIIGQKGINPTVASLVLSLESVFSALAGWVLLGQTLSAQEIAGCALMFGAIIIAQLPARQPKSNAQECFCSE